MAKPRPILSHMPWNIQRNIIEAVDLETKFSVRHCSKQLKKAVDQSKISLIGLSFHWEESSSYSEESLHVSYSHPLERSSGLVYFHPRPNGFLRETQDKSGQNVEKFVENGDYVDAGIEQFVKVLRQFPKLSLREICIEFQRHSTDVKGYELKKRVVEEKLNRALSSLNRKIRVSDVSIKSNDNADGVRQILSHFQPGTLEKITFMPDVLCLLRKVVQPLNLSEIVELEQWKRASSLHLYRFDIVLPLEKTAHFSELRYYPSTVNLEDVKYILDNILCKNGWTSRTMSTDRVDYHTFVSYLLHSETTRAPNAQTFIACNLFYQDLKREYPMSRRMSASTFPATQILKYPI